MNLVVSLLFMVMMSLMFLAREIFDLPDSAYMVGLYYGILGLYFKE